MFDPFDDSFFKPDPPVDVRPKQITMARWLMKLKCRRIRAIRAHIREGTWRYFIHGPLDYHRNILRDMHNEYQNILEAYEVEPTEEK